MAETPLALTRRARRIYRTLTDLFPDAVCELDFTSPFELLVATVLSAQTTDIRVNQVTPELFSSYPTPEALAAARAEDVEQIIHPTGFFRAKTASIIKLGQALVTDYNSVVPDTLDDLVTLPGVGRKTANVVLGNAFHTPGITVDTHFGRLSRRFRWTTSTDPVVVEHEVGDLIPRKEWTALSHRLIHHGRRICHSRRPACGVCPVARECPSYGEGETDPAKAEKKLRFDLTVDEITDRTGPIVLPTNRQLRRLRQKDPS